MRLLYWYTRFLNSQGEQTKYHGIEEFELNFSRDTKYHFNKETYELTETPYSTPLPDNFWGDPLLYNVNVIVGENGKGKTTVIHVVLDTLQELFDGKVKSQNETVFLAEIEYKSGFKKVLVYLPGSTNKKKEIRCVYDVLSLDYENLAYNYNYFNIIDNNIRKTKIIYHTNTLSKSDDDRYMGIYHSANNLPHVGYYFIYDCSLSAVIRHDQDADERTRQQDLLTAYYQTESYKQVKFVCDSTQYEYIKLLRNTGLPVPIPKKLFITINSDPINRSWSIEEKIFFIYCFMKSIKLRVNNKVKYILLFLCISSFNSFMYQGELEDSSIISNSNNLVALFMNVGGEINLDPSYLKNLKYCFRKFISFICHYDIENENNIIEFLNSNINSNIISMSDDDAWRGAIDEGTYDSNDKDNIREIIEQSIKDDINVLSLFDGGSVVFSISVNEDRNDWLIKFMELYILTCGPHYRRRKPHYFLDFSWGLSSGENNLLRLFSTLFYSLRYSKAPLYNWRNKQRIGKCQSLIIFMDEADLTYHPEWQRQLIKILTAFLPLEFGDCGLNSIQLILTTHSPLLLGDIPPNNVIYLKENTNNINTFGQNIHTILKDSFFLKNGIGAFAADKINRTAKILKYQKKKIIKIRKLSVKKTSHKNFMTSKNISLRPYIKSMLNKKRKIKKAGLKKIYSKQLSECKLVIDLLAPGIIKNRLTEFYDSAVNDNDIAVESIKKYAENLSNKELDEIIKKYQEVREMRGNNDKN